MPAVTSDYLPTILDLIGAKPVGDRPLDGISLRPLFNGAMKNRGQSIGFQSAGQVALIGDRFKLWGRTGGKQVDKLPTLKLFDLVNDPSEKTDVAAQHPEVVARMTRELKTWRASLEASDRGEDYPAK